MKGDYMEPMTAFLLSMQAAGLVTSIFSAHSQEKYIKIGRKLEQEQFTTNLQALRLQSAESSLDEMKKLRQNIGSQIAITAARSGKTNASAWGITESVKNFESDERKRRLNLLAQESNLRANEVLSGMHTLQSETQLGRSIASTALNMIPVSSLLSSAMNKSAKKSQSEFSWGY